MKQLSFQRFSDAAQEFDSLGHVICVNFVRHLRDLFSEKMLEVSFWSYLLPVDVKNTSLPSDANGADFRVRNVPWPVFHCGNCWEVSVRNFSEPFLRETSFEKHFVETVATFRGESSAIAYKVGEAHDLKDSDIALLNDVIKADAPFLSSASIFSIRNKEFVRDVPKGGHLVQAIDSTVEMSSQNGANTLSNKSSETDFSSCFV